MVEVKRLEAVFCRCFQSSHNTILCGGAEEPLYRPAVGPSQAHQVLYREDFFNSALHEIAHWCIAGDRRRGLLDYGYWYMPDGRGESSQMEFEEVEVRPQAIEWHFALACGRDFSVSLDNLTGLEHRRRPFSEAVAAQAAHYSVQGLPSRASLMVEELILEFGGGHGLVADFQVAA
jgi:elongation factor P hydroxylase